MNIPVIDFTECGLLKANDKDVREESYFEAGLELYRAFSEVGFAYVINYGISNEIVQEMNEFSDIFFALPAEEKMKFCNKKISGICYDPMGTTRPYKDREPEKLEGIRMVSWSDDVWPEIPGFEKKSLHFMDLCENLTHRLLKALGRGMKLKDVDLFSDSHKLLNSKGNGTQLKLTHYPAITGDVKKDSLRLAEHSDFGTLSLLFHEEYSICGLQAELSNGKYADIKQAPRGILLTVGDQFQFWTGGRLRSVKHRVVVPDDEKLRSKIRKSTVYFGVVDDEVLLEELEFEDSDGKNGTKMKPITGKEYFNKRFYEVYY